MTTPLHAKAFIFDLDGTLIKSAIDFTKLKRETLHHLTQLGVDTTALTTDMRTYQIMNHLKQKTTNPKPYHTILTQTTAIWDKIELETVDKTQIIPGAHTALRHLKDTQKKTAIITRGCRAYATAALSKVNLLQYVDLILGRDDTEEAKPSPQPLLRAMSILHVQPTETIMVGDTVEDAACAQRAGVAFIGVLTGLSDRQTLMRIGSVRVLANVGELPSLLEK